MRKFLIGQLGCYGDCLYATTVARQIKFDFPDCHITWAVSSKYKSILNLNPHVDEVWEIEDPDNKYDSEIWLKFEKEAKKKKKAGVFDELVLTQIPPKRWKYYDGTIRSTTLNGYNRPINVNISPVIILSNDEVANVSNFVKKFNLSQFKEVILFECSPGSGQSKVNIDFAKEVAEITTKSNPHICFIITSHRKIDFCSNQIIDASELTFRENVELTKYCTLLIGCSSGITWLSTSEWAKKIQTIQLLHPNPMLFAGMHFDFKINNLDYSHIIEMIDFDVKRVVKCINSVFNYNFLIVKEEMHQNYLPNKENLMGCIDRMLWNNESIMSIIKFRTIFLRKNKERNNFIEATNFYNIVFYASKYKANILLKKGLKFFY